MTAASFSFSSTALFIIVVPTAEASIRSGSRRAVVYYMDDFFDMDVAALLLDHEKLVVSRTDPGTVRPDCLPLMNSGWPGGPCHRKSSIVG